MAKFMNKNNRILILNISTDSENTSLGFAISWLNMFAENYNQVDVITLKKGDTNNLNKNVNVYEVVKDNNQLRKHKNLNELISKLTKENNYDFCLSHMSSIMIVSTFRILRKRNLKSILWYTHIGPNNIKEKLVLLFATLFAEKIITASENSFPLKRKKVNVIGHAIDYELFYKNVDRFNKKDFAIISRLSKSKNIDKAIEGFLDSNISKERVIFIIGGPLTKEDYEYEDYLIQKYNHNKNVTFVGSIPHLKLINKLETVGFHINNTPNGFYDKSFLETSIHGLINFYQNLDYDKNIPEEYIESLRFDGSSVDLAKKISNLSKFSESDYLKIIKHSQKEIENESINSLYDRIARVI